MSEPQKGPVAWFLSAARAVLFACVLLWIAVWLFQQIVWWLVALAVIALTVWAVVLVVRWRRDRWLR